MEMRHILQTARKLGASDIHLVAGLPPAFRLHGEIAFADAGPLTRDDARRLPFGLLPATRRREIVYTGGTPVPPEALLRECR